MVDRANKVASEPGAQVGRGPGTTGKSFLTSREIISGKHPKFHSESTYFARIRPVTSCHASCTMPRPYPSVGPRTMVSH